MLSVVTFLAFFLSSAIGRCTNVLPSGFNQLYTLDFTNDDYKKYFDEQYSYDQHTPDGEAKHFSLGTQSGKSALKITVFYNDKSFQENSTTDPRTELREENNPLTIGNEFLYQWSVFLDPSTKWGSINAFIHQFFCCPAMDLDTYDSNQYAYAHITQCDSDTKTVMRLNSSVATPQGDMGKWINWAVQYKSSDKSDGYVKVYRGTSDTCTEVFSYNGVSQSCNTNDGYFKMGIYRHTANVTAALWIADYVAYRKTG